MLIRVTATCLIVALSGAVHAKGGAAKPKPKAAELQGHQIMTPALQKDGFEVFTCRVVNTGKRPNKVEILILGSKGQALDTPKTAELKPGETTAESSATKNTIGYCKVTATESLETTLVTFCTQPFTGGSCQTVVTGQKS
jgi:hypothetical protein